MSLRLSRRLRGSLFKPPATGRHSMRAAEREIRPAPFETAKGPPHNQSNPRHPRFKWRRAKKAVRTVELTAAPKPPTLRRDGRTSTHPRLWA